MPLTRLDNLISSKTGKYLYVSPDDFNATDALDNRGNSPLRPFVSIQRAFLEAARFSYLPNVDNDRFDQFTIMLAPGNHYIDNRPGVEDVSTLPVFQFNQATQEWEANTNVSFDLSDPDNILYKFNGRDGGATIPRGTSLVGTDLRRTQVRALYVPDPADKDIPRTALFNVTGGCYFWQFTILDGDLEASSPLFNVGSPVGIGKVYTQPNDSTNLAIPEFSHHKITNFVFADREDLGLLYRKIARVFSDYQPSIDDVYVEGSNSPVTDSWESTVTYQIGDRVLYNGNAYVASEVSTNIAPDADEDKWGRLVIRGREFDYRVQENRIVGPLSDAVRLDEVTITDSNPPGAVNVRVRTKINHGFFPGQYVAISNNGLNTALNGVFKVTSISQTDPKEFEYVVATTATGLGLISGTTYTAVSAPALDTNATVQAEVDSVESASPYVFNVSIRSTWGICGIWADGRKATGFKSMVIAQYTGVSLQKDDRAFIRYDEFSNTWNQAPLTDAFATTPYHIKGDAYWKDDWRNFHVRASDDSFIQNVSIFAVGFADHFLLESGGDMSITNSNSNFGNTSMHSKGYKGFAFSQDKGGYITHIVPPKSLSTLRNIKQQYYTLDAQLTRASSNFSRLYFGSDDARSPEDRPAASIGGYRIGARRNEKLYVKLDTSAAKQAELTPTGFNRWVSALSTISPTGSRSVEDATRLYVNSNSGFVVGDFVKVDNEFFRITTLSATSFNVSRAQLNTLPSDHINGSTVTKYVQNSVSTTIISEEIDATETVFDVNDTTGFAPNMFASITNNQTSINETVRIVSVESLNQLVVERAQLGTVAVAQPTTALVELTTLANTYSVASPSVTTTLTERYPRIVPASNASERDYNLAQDAANLIDSNKTFIQSEAFGYILEKYPYLQNRSYVNPNITSETGRYRDASNLIRANRQEIIDYAFGQMTVAFPTFTVPNNDNDKCKRDIGYIVDAIADDLYDGGNAHMIASTRAYFDNSGALITNGVLGEQTQSIFAFNRTRDWAKKAISNLLSNTSLLDVISITSSGTTVTVTTGNPHNLEAGNIVTIGGATESEYNARATVLASNLTATQFQYTVSSAPSASPATGAYYASTVTIDPVNNSVDAGRYKDATNLINLNRQEIIDRAAAQVAIEHPDFYYPGDQQITSISRYKDSYRLIQQNRQEIIDRAAAEIAVQHPDFYYPGDAQTTSTSRYKDSYRLIQQNRQEIIDGAYAQIAIDYPSFVNPDPSKCQRDIGYFIDAVSLDISIGSGNVYARKFAQQYFTVSGAPISDGLLGEEQESITAFNKARDLMKSAIANQLTVKDLTVTVDPITGSNTDPNSCSNVQLAIDSLTTIITNVIAAGDVSGLAPENIGTVSDGEAKCKRDIGLFIDAVSLDIVQGSGNVYSRKFIQNYFDSTGTSWISNGLQGEEAQSITAFNKARDVMRLAVANQLYTKDLSITADPAPGSPYGTTGSNTDNNLNTALCSDVQSAISSLTTIITDVISAGNLTSLVSEVTPTISSGEAKCKRDIGYIVDSVAQDLFWGGNEFTVGAIREYFDNSGLPINNGLLNEESQSVTAFNAAKNVVKKAITNQLYAKNLDLSFGPFVAGGAGGDITYNASGNANTCTDVQTTVDNLFAIVTNVISTGSLANLPPSTNGSYDCANVRGTIDNLTAIITSALSSGNLNQLPETNVGPWSQVSEASKCKRDIGYIVEAVTSDLRLGGNENTINAAEAYYTAIPLANDTVDGRQDGYTLDYIENERPETIDAYNYVRNLAISAMRNHNTYINNASTTNGSAIVTVSSTIGLTIGMRVRSIDNIPTGPNDVVTYNTIIPDNAYIKKIGDGQNGLLSNQIELGRQGSKFGEGVTVSATSTSSTVKLYVELTEGIWSNTVNPSTDSAVIQDYEYLTAGDPSTGSPGGECASVANSLVNYFNIISTIINNGVGTVPRVASALNTASLAQRGTLFSLTEYDSNGNPTTNPHNLESGTPVRLIPSARPGSNPDKRVIRLPKGFDTNTTYYVIAPGRRTDPFDYSNSVGFNGANQQTLMLATSEENAAAGIYIYSSETDSVDPDVNIDVYQYVLDIKYDLHQYETRIAQNSSTEFETSRPHIFDKPADGVTPQLVFFRVGSDIIGSSLPTLSSTFGGTVISEKQEYYVRYVSSRRFTIHQTFADARDNINPVTFQPGSTSVFYTFASKRRSPLKYDPVVGGSNDGCWYLDSLTANNEIIPRVKQSDYAGRIRTTDTYFERIEDNRSAADRVYRLRYVIPKNLKTVRDPLRGFVLKVRTDEKRRLLPQKILLKPTAAGSSLATINAPLTGERLGLTLEEQVTLNPNFESTYDPGPQGNLKRIETDSKISFTTQSARKRRIGNLDYLELTVFDVGVDAEAYKTKLFTTVKISAPEGGDGSFVESIPNSNSTNRITWDGNSKGTAYVHAYFAYENDYYMILKDFSGNSEINYDVNNPTTFTQGSVTATLLDAPNGGRSDIANFLYVVEGANVYTMTPGDTLNDDQGVSYTIAEVEDVSELESTFYIFDINTIRRRIAGQQDGVYYLTCLRGDIRPYPTGSGVGENFRNFRFSQPVSKLYPEFYKNDPEWYKGISPATATLLDPPPTISAADNYVHGLVTVNDSKGSVTKELVLDLVSDPGAGNYTFTGNNAIQAQPGSASAGSEGRLIPISGDSRYPTEGKLYVELRRPSIARSGNHTFEYLGFGPGNYSTGFPARQEVVLTDVQDFYAQAKREDAGIVFYTGLNSNGDLYIGNRKINAITGEETFLERAALVESEDEGDSIGNLVTTFDTPVTFNDIITVNGGDGSNESFFNSPVVVNNPTSFGTVENYPSLKIVTGEGTPVGFDQYLEYNTVGQRTGDIVLHQNRITAAIFDFNPRGTQDYTIRTALSNITPDFNNTFGQTTGFTSQILNTDFGTRDPLKSGDLLLKGDQTSFTGSLGWIYANDYIALQNRSDGSTTPQVVGIQGNATGTYARIYWNTGVDNTSLSINSSTQIRITGATGSLAATNGVWNIVPGSFNGAENYIDVILLTNLSVYPVNLNNGKGYPVDQVAQPNIAISRSSSQFKEWGVLGAEAIRTETSNIGDYKLGINTVARSPHSAYLNAFVSPETTPRANLDVVGTAFISGKTINSYLTEQTATKTETPVDTAFMVGGNSLSLNGSATFRVMTTNNGRVGINTSLVDAVTPSNVLDRNFVVVGNARVTSDFELTGDLQVNGGDLTTTSTSFNLVNTNANILNFAGDAEVISLGTNTSGDQTLNIGNNASSHYVQIGNAATETSLRIHRNSTNAVVDIASVSDTIGNSCEVTIGGAWQNTASFTDIRTRQTRIAGELEIGTRYAPGTSQARIFTQTRVANIFDGDQTNTVNLATNATSFSMGSLGGTTTVRNTLNVLASNNVNGNIRLNGGLNAGIVEIVRGRFSTTPVGHNVGSLENTNIDFYQYNTTGRVIDTQGVALWGGTNFLIAGGQIAGIDNITNTGGANRIPGVYNFLNVTGGSGTGASFNVTVNNDRTIEIDIVSPGVGYTDNDLLTITNNQLGGGAGGGDLTFQVSGINAGGSNYYLPISTPGVFDFRVGDLLLIDRGDAATPDIVGDGSGGQITGLRNQANSEIVRVTGLTNLSNPNDPEGYRIEVVRGQDGTQTRTDHPQGCIIAKLVKQTNASYITGSDLDDDGVIDTPVTGITAGTSNVNIGVAEFGGVLTTRDFLRLSGSEIVGVARTVSSDIQVLEVNDGSTTPATVFRVESTTGNTIIGGDLGVGTGFNRLTVQGSTGNTNITGTLTTENTLTINGSTVENTQFFTITNGGSTGIPLRTTFQIDTANGNVRMNGGNINIYGTDGTTPRLTFNNSSGDFTTYGSFSALGTGPSTFGGDIVVAGDATINGGDLTVNSGGNPIFEVNNNGSMRIAGINNYFTQTGGRRWEYADGFVVEAEANVNYFVNATQNTLFKLPQNALIGDMIRIIDIGGNLNYNLSLIVRAPDNVKVQNASDNTARNIASGIPISDFAGYNGGEMVVQTPYAAFGLVFAGSTTPDGNTAVPSSIAGWYLIEV
jgi:hypothetical protein